MHLAILPKPDGACDGLALYGGVPLQLDDEDAVGAGEVQPESSSISHMLEQGASKAASIPEPTSASRHDEHWSLVIIGKLVEPDLSLPGGTAAVYVEVRNFRIVQVLGQ